MIAEFPQVQLIHGTGDLYWVGGMRAARDRAIQSEADFLVWLNDDVELEPDAFSRLLMTLDEVPTAAERTIVVGALRDPGSRDTSYSGVVKAKRWHPMRFVSVDPADFPQLCDTMNGNLVLYPRAVDLLVGNIDSAFIHTMGDFDFGLRAKDLGCTIWLAWGYLGTCERNEIMGAHLNERLSVGERFRKIRSVKNMYPSSRLVFLRRYGGLGWPLFWLSPYLKIVLTALWHRFSKNRSNDQR